MISVISAPVAGWYEIETHLPAYFHKDLARKGKREKEILLFMNIT